MTGSKPTAGSNWSVIGFKGLQMKLYLITFFDVDFIFLCARAG